MILNKFKNYRKIQSTFKFLQTNVQGNEKSAYPSLPRILIIVIGIG